MAEIIRHRMPGDRNPVGQSAAQAGGRELIEGIAVPPAVNIRIAEAKQSVEHHSAEKPWIVDPHIPGPGAADADIDGFKKAGAPPLTSGFRGLWLSSKREWIR